MNAATQLDPYTQHATFRRVATLAGSWETHTTAEGPRAMNPESHAAFVAAEAAQIALTTYPEASAREHERRLALQSELVLAEKLEARGAPAASGPRASRVARARVGIVGARRRRVARRGGDPPAPPA